MSAKKPLRGQKSANPKRDRIFIACMLFPGIAMVALFYYYPFLSGIPNAFKYYNLFRIKRTRWIGLDNFVELFTEREFLLTLSNTAQWVFVSLFFQFMIGFVLAMFLKKPFRGRGVYQGAIFFPWAVSGFLIGILWRWMYNAAYGPINGLLLALGITDAANPIGFLSDMSLAMPSVIATNVWYGIAFFTIMIQAALQGVPDELYEASRVDGATKPQQFFHITLPYIYPVLILTTLLRSIWIFNFADLIYSITRGGPGGSTEIMTSYMLNLIMFQSNYGKASAVGLIIILLLLAWSVLYLKISRFEEGSEF
ncbi:MAG: carbohydrate ABC transporter permease [Christensenellales bacterium]|jgi:multiple sugar transport system permease protein